MAHSLEVVMRVMKARVEASRRNRTVSRFQEDKPHLLLHVYKENDTDFWYVEASRGETGSYFNPAVAIDIALRGLS